MVMWQSMMCNSKTGKAWGIRNDAPIHHTTR
jgi:hypothetical protein